MRIINEEPQSISKEKCEEFIKTFNRLYEVNINLIMKIIKNRLTSEKFGLYKQFIKTDCRDIMKNLKLILENSNKIYEEMNVEAQKNLWTRKNM